MEDEILVGDLLFGNKWIYGMRTPTWFGIPYTRKGFDLPWTRLPSFKNVENGDVTIFEYPSETGGLYFFFEFSSILFLNFWCRDHSF